MAHTKNWISIANRLAIYDRDKNKITGKLHCFYCQQIVKIGFGQGDLIATLDHITPYSEKEKSSNEPTNLITSCMLCNSTRKNMPIEQWLKLWKISPLTLELRLNTAVNSTLLKSLRNLKKQGNSNQSIRLHYKQVWNRNVAW